MGLRFGYVTNGLSGHRLDDAIALVSDAGYDGIALTLDHHHLDPFAPDLAGRVAAFARATAREGLAVVIETGAGFLLDPRRRHRPTLMCDDSGRRLDLLLRAIDIAAEVGAEVVSCWSGACPPGLAPDEARRRLTSGCETLLAHAEARSITLGLEPEPGMLIETIADAEALREQLDRHIRLGITLDVGHCTCVEPEPVDACIARAASWLVNAHIEDMRRGVHEHLDFGEGDVEFPRALAALDAASYTGLVSVELSRHSHAAHETVPRSLAFLRDAAAMAAR